MALIILGAVFLLLSPTPARADATHRLRDAILLEPDRCLRPEPFADRVAAWLRRDAIDARIDVRVFGDSASEVRFEVRRSGRVVGERALSTGHLSCGHAVEVVSLAVAMAVEATLLDAAEPEPERTLILLPTTRIVSGRPPPAPPAVVTERGPLPRVRAEERVFLGVLPRAALGGAVGLRVPTGEVTWGVDGFAAFAGPASIGSGFASSRLLGGQATVCLQRGRGALTGGACVGVAAAVLRGEGIGFERSNVTHLPWGAAVGGVEGRARIAPWLGVVLGADVYVPWLRPTLEVERSGGGVIARQRLPAVGAGLRLGFEVAP